MDDTHISQEMELKACAEDFIYFCKNYVKVINYHKGLVPLELYDYQKNFIKKIAIHRFLIAKKFRQGGFSTICAAYAAWLCMFKEQQAIMFFSKTDREAVAVGDIVNGIISNLPDWLKPELGKNNSHYKEFTKTKSRLSSA